MEHCRGLLCVLCVRFSASQGLCRLNASRFCFGCFCVVIFCVCFVAMLGVSVGALLTLRAVCVVARVECWGVAYVALSVCV